MKICILWYCDDKKLSLAECVQRACDYYRSKYGAIPNLCYVHPSLVPEQGRVGGVEIVGARTVLPDHFWIGIKE